MKFSNKQFSVVSIFITALFIVAIALLGHTGVVAADEGIKRLDNPWGPSQPAAPEGTITPDGKIIIHKRSINAGDEEVLSARSYYSRLHTDIAFPYNADKAVASTMQELLTYLGYGSISPRSLESGEPADLMAANQGVLVSRFFAPKIVNYAKDPPYTAGWRKLVYLPAVNGSVAKNNRITGGYILFNYFQPNASTDPFKSGDEHATSGNNQVILIPEQKSQDTAYFAVYANKLEGGRPNAYPISNFLSAGFDIPKDGELKDYFVPQACAHCHGQDKGAGGNPDVVDGKKIFKNVKPNYLDSDQWYDAERLDFPEVLAQKFDPIYDGGRDHDSNQYRVAVDTIRRINEQIKIDGKNVPSSTRSEDAVQLWLDNHARLGPKPVAIHERGLSNADREYRWDSSNPFEMEALSILSQNCFRCHGSIKYNVFDKQALLERKASGYLDGYMPLGRPLSSETENCLKSLLGAMESNTSLDQSTCDSRFGSTFVEPYGGSSSDRFKVRNLKLDSQRNSISVEPGTSIQASLDVNHDCPECGGAINQVIVGYAGQPNATACVWSGGRSSGGWKRVYFDLEAPNDSGSHDVRVRYAQAYGCSTALQWWRVDRPQGPTAAATIGTITVN